MTWGSYADIDALAWESSDKSLPGSCPMTSAVVDHGVTDDKGRPVGGYARIRASSDGAYLVCTFATRDGKQFGAAFPAETRWHDLRVAKQQAGLKLKAQGRRARKAFGSGQ